MSERSQVARVLVRGACVVMAAATTGCATLARTALEDLTGD